ncbi:MAG: AI-2E family transporter [Ruminococcaceae bacterium]|nr:AI-2E family transporter [Oscillospiraceae bacterium]
MPKEMEKRSQSRGQFLVNLLYYAAWAALAVGAVWVAIRWLMPFVLALVTAALLQRPLRWLAVRTRVSRGFLSGLLVVLLVAAVAAAVGGIGWWLWRNAVTLVSDEGWVNRLTARFAAAWDTLRAWGERFLQRFSPATQAALRAVAAGLPAADGLFGEWLRRAAGGAARFATQSLPSLVFSFFIWALATVFLAGDFPRVLTFLRERIPPRFRGTASELRVLCGGTLFEMAKAYLLLMGVTFSELCIGLWLLRVRGALWLAALIALVDIFPVLGVGTVLLPWTAVAALTGDVRFSAWLLVLYLVVTLVRNLLEPRLISRRIGLPPALTLLSLYLGLRVAGVAGVLIAPVAVTLAAEIWRKKQRSVA